MTKDFIPRRDQALAAFTLNISQKLSAAPTDYGQSPAIAATYQTKQQAFASALAVSCDPLTAGPHATLLKNTAKSDLVDYTRLVARAIQGTITVSDAQRQELGLPLRDVEPTPVGAPGAAPLITAEPLEGNMVRVKALDSENPTRRGRPAACAGLAVYSYVGETPPVEMSKYHHQGNSSRTTALLQFDPTLPVGTKVWISAYWFSTSRMLPGPGAQPVSVLLRGGLSAAA